MCGVHHVRSWVELERRRRDEADEGVHRDAELRTHMCPFACIYMFCPIRVPICVPHLLVRGCQVADLHAAPGGDGSERREAHAKRVCDVCKLGGGEADGGGERAERVADL